MTTRSKPVSDEIFSYIKKYYNGAFLSDITTEMDEDKRLYYTISASLEDAIYHLKFNSYGTLVHRDVEPLFELSDEGFDIPD